MIYIDPPYNTDKDFVYPDRYTEGLASYLHYTGQKTAAGDWQVSNSGRDTVGRRHTAWLNMMMPRLKLARTLMRDDGLIFVSINDKEAPRLRGLLDEVFGEESFVAQLVWNTEGHTDNQYDVKVNHEYILCFAKNREKASLGHVIDPNTREESNLWKGFAENSITKNGPANPPSKINIPLGFPTAEEVMSLSETTIPNSFFSEVESLGYISREITAKYEMSYPIRKNILRAKDYKTTTEVVLFAGWANADKLKRFIANNFEPLEEDDGSKLSFYLSKNGVVYYRRDREKARNIVSVLRNLGTTEQMRSEIESLGVPFSYPKPKQLLKYLIEIGCEKDGIVLDFFAGSGATLQAVAELGVEKSVVRPTILVQLPQHFNSSEADQKRAIEFCKSNAKPENLAEVSKEYLRRRLRKLSEQYGSSTDLGLKVFRLQKSNINTWNPDRTDLEATLLSHTEHLAHGRSEQDVLYELLLKRGIELTVPIEEKKVAGKTIYSIGYGVLFACLDISISKDDVDAVAGAIAAWHKELEPETDSHVFFRDSAFADDIAKTNMAAILEQNGIAHVRSL